MIRYTKFGGKRVKTIDDVLYELLVSFYSGNNEKVESYTTSALNPKACFSYVNCSNPKENAAQGIAEFIYLLSGMNTNDFIWEFRGLSDPRAKIEKVEDAVGQSLRFQGFSKTNIPLNYKNSLFVRIDNRGFIDQLAVAVELLKLKPYSNYVFIPLSFVTEEFDVHSIEFYLRKDNEKTVLDMRVATGNIHGLKNLMRKVLTPFMLLHQLVASVTDIAIGEITFMLGCVYRDVDEIKPRKKRKGFNLYSDEILGDFDYSKMKMTIEDIDNLLQLLIEFTSRLDKTTITRGNPFYCDDNVAMFNDFAEVIRVWKADKLGISGVDAKCLYNPLLQYIFSDGSVVC